MSHPATRAERRAIRQRCKGRRARLSRYLDRSTNL